MLVPRLPITTLRILEDTVLKGEVHMKPKNHEGRTSQGKRTAACRRPGLILLIAMAVWTTCAVSYAQTVIGSPGAGFQNWTAADLNNNGAPFWDAPTTNSQGNPDSKNVGYCLTGGG